MNQLSTEEKRAIVGLYLGQSISHEPEDEETSQIIGVCSSGAHCIHDGTGSYGIVPFDGFKILLRPLSAITDEDAIEMAKMVAGNAKEFCQAAHTIKRGEGAVVVKAFPVAICISFDGGLRSTARGFDLPICEPFFPFQYLISKGYAVPLYPWNKTAIDLGLALDSTLKPE